MESAFSNSTKADSTKGKIIEILSYEWPLSLRKIYYLVKKKGINITYQAVHKAIHQLVEEKKLKKTTDGYLLNLEWIKEIHDKTEIIRVNYFSKKRSFMASELDTSEIQVFIFNTWFDLEKYIYYIQKKILKKDRDKESICIHHHHEWRPLFYLRAEYNWVKKLTTQGYKLYSICSGKTFLDTWSKKFYKSLGSEVITGITLNGPAEIVVFADMVIEIYIPIDLLNIMESHIKKCQSLEELNLTWMIENIFEKQTEIKAVIHKDRKLSDEIREHLISHFK